MSSAIAVYSGKLVDPFNLQPGDIVLEDGAHALSILSRYTGHTVFPYSVAEHSVLLSRAVPPHLARAALLHDFNEAYTNDLPRPIKSRLPQFGEFEKIVQKQIFAHFNEPWENMEAIAEYDLRICVNEMQQIFTVWDPKWLPPVKGLAVNVEGWDWRTAKHAFLDRFEELSK